MCMIRMYVCYSGVPLPFGSSRPPTAGQPLGTLLGVHLGVVAMGCLGMRPIYLL